MGIGMPDQLVHPLGGGIKRVGMVDGIANRERRLCVGAIDGRGTGIDKVLQRRQGARKLLHDELTHHIGGDIGVRIDERIAHPRLCGQMHDVCDARKIGRQLEHGRAIGNVDLVKVKMRPGRQPVQPRLFQPDIVIVVEIVHSDDMGASREQGVRHRRADKAGGARHQNGAAIHGRPTLIY